MSMVELELSEEEKAELLASLTVGLSESIVSHDTSTKSVVLKKEKKKFIGPPIPVHRDGMGKYIPEPGGRPLSLCDSRSPGPAGYCPDYKTVCKKYPEYSMGERPVEVRRKKGTPAPNKYNVTKDVVWGKCKRISFKEELPKRLYEASPGPAAYPTMKSTLGGPKHSMPKAKKDDVIHGLVSSLAEIPDKSIPGPSYFACGDEWLQRPQTFGDKPRYRKPKYPTPGPSVYRPKVASSAPKWGMGLAARKSYATAGPGPAAYKRKSLVPGGERYSIGVKIQPFKEKFPIPGPDQYSKEGFRLDEPGFTLQYRWFDREPDGLPGPGHYRWKKDPRAKNSPAYSFPKYFPGQEDGKSPGPAHYTVSAPPLDKGRTIGLRLQPEIADGPGPGEYNPERLEKTAPAYSMAGKHERKDGEIDEPGPSDYRIKYSVIETQGGRSIGLKFPSKTSTCGPGPAPRPVRDATQADACRGCECVKGVTVKSRHTPCKYSGFRNLARVVKPSKDFPKAPLLG